MKFLIENTFLYRNVMLMLHELYNQHSTEAYSDYVLLCELSQVPKIKELKAKGLKVIFYDLEHTKSMNFTINGRSYFDYFTKDVMPIVDEFWTYTLENQAFYKSNGFDVKFQPFLYVDILKETELLSNQSVIKRPIDVLFYGRTTEYRQSLFNKIQDMGVSFITAHAVTSSKLKWLMNNSKIILDTRQCDEYYNQNVVRLFYPVINKCCILSQRSSDDHYMGNSVEYFTDDTDIQSKIASLLYGNNWQKIGFEADLKFKSLCASNDVWHTSDIEIN